METGIKLIKLVLVFLPMVFGSLGYGQRITEISVVPAHSWGWYFNFSGVMNFTPNSSLPPITYHTGCVIYNQYRLYDRLFVNFGAGFNYVAVSAHYRFMYIHQGDLSWTKVFPAISYYSPIINVPISVKRIYESKRNWFSGVEVGYAPGVALHLRNYGTDIRIAEYKRFRSAAFATFTLNRWDEKGRILSKYGLISYFYPHKPIRHADAPISTAQWTLGVFVGF